ncbi:MAG: iron reductase [Alphaproteobacteria bacterium HGW-Alphaproteobacteria-6]|nr:MAG: iron reductase [Alphaproteobacteria bacterium HGW-Alphaproteobacteria-6]
MSKVTGSGLRRIIDERLLFWALLALPAAVLIALKLGPGLKLNYLYWTGVLSCWLLILAMAVTPLQMLFGPLPWLRVRRRYLGVAAFGYGVLHLVVWVLGKSVADFLNSFVRAEVLPGWIGLAIMLVLAAISFDGAVRRLGPRWKAIQRWVYPAAVLTLVHWVMTTGNMTTVVLSSAPLAALSLWRLGRGGGRLRRG